MRHENVKDKTGKTREMVNKILSLKHKSPFVGTLIEAMSDAGCKVNPYKHICIEDCHSNFNIFGGFDSENNQVVLCQNKFDDVYLDFDKFAQMESLLSHELVHAFDHCRANVDFYTNPKHLMCSEIRAASLSGQCTYGSNVIESTLNAVQSYHKTCVRKAALRSFRALFPAWSLDQSYDLLNEVFYSCYNDFSPFDRIPLTKKQAELSYKAYLNRHRYKV
ncbi:mitochondrial inner membrane protease ATP23 homolog [Clavelina lepadiformis]|uniref:mitochondrial inner membrane protease ATP23 homolog n=1 Tax=Clavelina lepadiformis TaxID=159417 RepID=UPI0040426B10